MLCGIRAKIQQSNCTPELASAWSMIITGIAMSTIIPLVLGCLGKYGVIPMSKSFSKAMITSSATAIAFIALAKIGQLLYKHAPCCAYAREQVQNLKGIVHDQFQQVQNAAEEALGQHEQPQ
ncbi:MAG: hypothetical protein S4CHLAM81_05880 [Chlamydiales bacterium]|nr:hypothetical protein [Chlamydiales bacterium]MCH9635373.1 hypothetical protein [Chlamydiales bacterium]MCH9703806.1 hypothetical protein [Chlamydiota bacterium]